MEQGKEEDVSIYIVLSFGGPNPLSTNVYYDRRLFRITDNHYIPIAVTYKLVHSACPRIFLMNSNNNLTTSTQDEITSRQYYRIITNAQEG